MRSWWLARGVRQPPASRGGFGRRLPSKSSGWLAGLKNRRLQPPAIERFQWRALAAMAPAAAPRANHFRARALRWRTRPPLAALTASSRDLVRVAVLLFSSARSACAAVSLAWQVLQSRM